jgi:hypothetical protein
VNGRDDARRGPRRQNRRRGGQADALAAARGGGRTIGSVAANATALVREGRAALSRGEWATARASFEASLERDAEAGDALLGLSDAHWWLGQTEGAVRYGSGLTPPSGGSGIWYRPRPPR